MVAPDYRIKRGDVTRHNGTSFVRVAQCVFDTAGTDTSGAANTTIAAHGLGVYIPDNAIITGFFYEVLTTFTSATDAATIAIKAQSANDLISAIAISDATNVWDAGVHAGLPGYPNLGADAAHDSQVEVAALFAATYIKMTAERELTATVAVEALTAGKAVLYVTYVVGD